MAAVGICGTDLHSIKGEWERPTPMVLGHEGAGVVEAVGGAVEGLAPGDEVVLSRAPSCGKCSDCRRGRPAACVPLHRAIGAGTLVDGTTGMSLRGETVYRGTATGCLAERVVVSSNVALPTGGAVPLRERHARCGGARRRRRRRRPVRRPGSAHRGGRGDRRGGSLRGQARAGALPRRDARRCPGRSERGVAGDRA